MPLSPSPGYLDTVQRRLVDHYGFPERWLHASHPVPDGEYPVVIDGRCDLVIIDDGRVSCENHGTIIMRPQEEVWWATLLDVCRKDGELMYMVRLPGGGPSYDLWPLADHGTYQFQLDLPF